MSTRRATSGTDEVAALAAALTAASRALVSVAIRSVNTAPVDITMTQFRVLTLLESRGEQTVGAIASHIAVDQSNASRLCGRLQRLGMVSRTPSAADRRSVVVGLTSTGRSLIASVDSHRRDEIGRILADLDPARIPDLLEALTVFSDAADAAERAVPPGS